MLNRHGKQHHLLILSLNSLWTTPNFKHSLTCFSQKRITLLVHVLQKLGYVATTIQQAMRQNHKKSFVFTWEISSGNQLCEKNLNAFDFPVTLFINTSSMEWLKNFQRGDPHKKDVFEKYQNVISLLHKKNCELGLAGHELLDLTSMNQTQQLKYLKDSKDIFIQQFGLTPSTFLYPFGAYDASTVSMLRQLGFKAGVTSVEGLNLNHSPLGENFHLKRLIFGSNWPLFFIKIFKYCCDDLFPRNPMDSMTQDLIKFPS